MQYKTMKKLIPAVLLLILSMATSSHAQEAKLSLSLKEANRLAVMPMHCTQVEYPNKLSQTLGNASQLKEPKALHPAFYGCFDWHSSVHGHWMMVNLLRHFPQLAEQEAIRATLKTNLTAQNIVTEVEYFEQPLNGTYERTYGWAWLLKLSEELHQWDDPLARQLEENLQPLTHLIVNKYKDFLPKLIYPIRTGEHPNTAFALSLAYDFAQTTEQNELLMLIRERAKLWFGEDKQCPLSWEPNGFDFLSPCFEEVDIMRKVLNDDDFLAWLNGFLPNLGDETFSLKPAKVSDRTDGKLVHLDGLNFSRAWCLFGLANDYSEQFSHLQDIASNHVTHSLPAIVDDHYEGTHWLGSFAVYALQASGELNKE